MTRVSSAVLACLCLGSAQAAVYRWMAPDGSVVFADNPPQGEQRSPVQEVHISPPKTVPPMIPLRSERRSPPADTLHPPSGYTSFAIVHPINDAVLRENSGSVAVEISVEPSLRPGHRIVLSMDGKVTAQGPQTAFQLLNVDRGTHTLEASVQDDSNQLASAASPITFTLQRFSVLHKFEAPIPVPLRRSRHSFEPRVLSDPR